MGTRIGSLLLILLLAGLVAAAAVVIAILVDDDNGGPGSFLAPSIREGELLLINEPREIQVVAGDSDPVTGITLLADGAVITQVVPVADTDQGTYRATLSWTPDRIGFITLTFTAIDLNGDQTNVEFQVEVTDDPERVAAALRVSIVGLRPLQQVPLNETVRVLARADGDREVTTFELSINGRAISQVEAQLAETGYVGRFDWIPNELGETDVAVRAIASDGTTAVADLRLEVVETVQASAQSAQQSQEAGAQEQAAQAASDDARAVIASPDDDAEFEFSQDLEIEIVVEATGTGTVNSLEIYLNIVLFVGITPQPRADGSYREVVTFQPAEPGAYIIEAVAFNTSGQRFGHRITIRVTDPEAESEEQEQAQQEAEDPDAAQLPDLRPAGAALGKEGELVVTIANAGELPIVGVELLVTALRAADGLLLGEQRFQLVIPPAGERIVVLPVIISEPIEVSIVLDLLDEFEEADEENNTLLILLEPETQPDLVPVTLQLSTDGFPVVEIVNAGAGPVTSPIVVSLVFNGEIVEALEFSGALGPQGRLALSGLTPISGEGQLSAVVDPANAIAELDEGNNAITITVPAQ